jgi:hypothetical protein
VNSKVSCICLNVKKINKKAAFENILLHKQLNIFILKLYRMNRSFEKVFLCIEHYFNIKEKKLITHFSNFISTKVGFKEFQHFCQKVFQ